jgi:AraC-like DNA-binding protein
LALPPEVHVSHKKLVSRQTGAHGPRLYGNASAPTVQWRKDDQEATRVPILVCVINGHADFQIGNYVLHCPEGTFIFIPPGIPHPGGVRSHLEAENRENGSCDLLWITPHGRRIQCWMCSSRGEEHKIANGHENLIPLNDQLGNFLEFMQEEAVACQPDYEKLFGSALTLMLQALLRDVKAQRFLQLGVNAHETPTTNENYDPIERAHEYIKSHLAANLTIDKVSYVVHMSRAQFTRRFHQQTGQTFTQYVSGLRVEQASVFLRETDWSVAQISEFVGFRSVPYFHALFRRTTGHTPIEYRRTHASKTPDFTDRITQNET